MYFIRAVEGNKCLVVNTKTKEKRWFSSQTILKGFPKGLKIVRI